MSVPSGAAAGWAAACWARRCGGWRARADGAYLWVFDGNTRAIDFYRRLGGEIVEGGFDEIDGLQIPHSRIAWRDTTRLVEACGTADFRSLTRRLARRI